MRRSPEPMGWAEHAAYGLGRLLCWKLHRLVQYGWARGRNGYAEPEWMSRLTLIVFLGVMSALCVY